MTEADDAASTSEHRSTCRVEANAAVAYRGRVKDLSETIIRDCSAEGCHTHIGFEPIPSRDAVVEIIDRSRELLFPGFFSRDRIDPVNAQYVIGQAVTTLFDLLSDQITRSIRHECFRFERDCSNCEERGYQAALDFLAEIPALRRAPGGRHPGHVRGRPGGQDHR